ncbi:unnamed protein product [Rotaria magnacalcarata]
MNQGGRGGTLSSLDPERRVNGSAATVPIFDAWRSTLYSIRKTTLPTVPTSIDSITIPDIMSFTHSHEQFLFCNTNAQHKIIAFTSESALKILSKNHHWNVDGTFDGRFSSVLWNHFDSIGERSRTNNHLEDWHRQLIARIRVHPDLWTWFNEIKSSEESVMIRHEQEQAQQRTTRPKKAINIRDDAKLKAARLKYLQDQDFDSYRKIVAMRSNFLIHMNESSCLPMLRIPDHFLR